MTSNHVPRHASQEPRSGAMAARTNGGSAPHRRAPGPIERRAVAPTGAAARKGLPWPTMMLSGALPILAGATGPIDLPGAGELPAWVLILIGIFGPSFSVAMFRGRRAARRAFAAYVRAKGQAMLDDKDKTNDATGKGLLAGADALDDDREPGKDGDE